MLAQSGLTMLFRFSRSGSGRNLEMAGGLHLEASSRSFPTRIDPATPIPTPRAAPVMVAVFWLFSRSLVGRSLLDAVDVSIKTRQLED